MKIEVDEDMPETEVITELGREEALQMIQEATPDFVNLMVMAAKLKDPDLKELNFVHQILEFPSGERYMLQLVYLEGPKLKLKPEDLEKSDRR